MNATANDNSGKPDASKVARPVWGWGLAVMPALHHVDDLDEVDEEEEIAEEVAVPARA